MSHIRTWMEAVQREEKGRIMRSANIGGAADG